MDNDVKHHSRLVALHTPCRLIPAHCTEENRVASPYTICRSKCIQKSKPGLCCAKPHSHERLIIASAKHPSERHLHRVARALRLALRLSCYRTWALWEQEKLQEIMKTCAKRLRFDASMEFYCPCGAFKQCRMPVATSQRRTRHGAFGQFNRSCLIFHSKALMQFVSLMQNITEGACVRHLAQVVRQAQLYHLRKSEPVSSTLKKILLCVAGHWSWNNYQVGRKEERLVNPLHSSTPRPLCTNCTAAAIPKQGSGSSLGISLWMKPFSEYSMSMTCSLAAQSFGPCYPSYPTSRS